MSFIFLEFQQFFLMLSATIVMAIACLKRRDLSYWLLAYIFLTIGVLFRAFIYLVESFNVIANFGYVIAMFFTFIAISTDYYKTFLKTNKKSIRILHVNVLSIGIVSFSIILTTLIIAFINMILIIRLYLKKRTATYAFFGLSVFASFITLLFTGLYNWGIEWAYEFSEGVDNILYSFLLVTGIIALLENRIKESKIRYKDAYNRSEFYKDLIAHDTANILQNMATSLDIASIYIKDLEDHKEITQLIKTMEDQIQRGKNLIYNVRTITDFETGTYSKKNLDICDVIGKLIDYISESYTKKKINFKLNAKKDSFYVRANDFILNVFENIIINAIKHNDKDKVKISINIEEIEKDQKKYVQIEFIDNGRGIREQLKEEIFKKEYTSNNLLKRTSLGLYLVKRIIESFNGQIEVKNRVEEDHSKGSIFIILFPSI